jgi:hypothetical protein
MYQIYHNPTHLTYRNLFLLKKKKKKINPKKKKIKKNKALTEDYNIT